MHTPPPVRRRTRRRASALAWSPGAAAAPRTAQTKAEAGAELTATPGATASPAADAKVIAVTITCRLGHALRRPRSKVKRNQPVVLQINAVRPARSTCTALPRSRSSSRPGRPR